MQKGLFIAEQQQKRTWGATSKKIQATIQEELFVAK
jgi:hypothetical protein